jgi:hypothetical protein
MLRLFGCFVCVWFTAAAGFNLSVRVMAEHGILRDPVSPSGTWLNIISCVVIAAGVLCALTRKDKN